MKAQGQALNSPTLRGQVEEEGVAKVTEKQQPESEENQNRVILWKSGVESVLEVERNW